ncbi:MAG: NUDIX domain-containing protein [Rhizobiales bacterium]|nr:NUDIX domain-containing protein [Hyphomicrobiales bacterium]
MTESTGETRTERLTRVTRDMSHPNQRPHDAATLILLDRSGPKPKVLMGRRHARHAFMPDVFVFPGGRLDPADRLLSAEGALDPRIEARLMKGMPKASRSKARALALAAIRECFEETGLLIGSRRADAPDNPDGRWQDFAPNGIVPDLAGLHFIARAITPPRRPRRYDTRFFAADVDRARHRVEGVTGPEAELIEVVWLPLGEARRLDMPEITGVVLEELEARIRGGLSHDLPVPFYRMLNRKFVCDML